MLGWFLIVTQGAIEICHMTYKLDFSKINLNQYLGMYGGSTY
jgi:hypothetical protein